MNAVMETSNSTPTAVLPWNDWPNPSVHSASLASLSVRATGENTEGFGGNLVLLNDGTELGRVTSRGMQQLGHKLSPCPEGFISKLPTRLQAEVLNSRIQAHYGGEVALVIQGDEFTNFLPSVREVLTYQETAQHAWETMGNLFGTGLTVDVASLGTGGMTVRLLTDLQQPVTRKVGDVLGLGIELFQDYGKTTDVSLYLRRLVCLNGMTREQGGFSWQSRSENSRDHQKMWLSESIADALGAYEEMVDRSRLMAETTFEGDPEDVLRERARAMGLGQRHFASLWQAFNQEPGNTEWDLLNAFTRIGTHTALPGNLGRRVQSAAGTWAQHFDMVNCRLPRPMANRIGATIIEQIDNIPDIDES